MSKVISLFSKDNYIDSIILSKDSNIFQVFKYKDKVLSYETPVICIVKLRSNRYSTVCIIDNEISITETNELIDVISLNVNGQEVSLLDYVYDKEEVQEFKDLSDSYVWITDEYMNFLKIDSWVIVKGGFLKSICIDDFNNKSFLDNLEGKKVYCSNNTYLALKDIVK